MRGKDFLIMARLLVKQPYESGRRSAAGRAYYALLHEAARALRSWGWAAPPRDSFHAAVRSAYVPASDHELQEIGYALEELVLLRNAADYDLASPGSFGDIEKIRQAIERADDMIKLLEAIDRDRPAEAKAAWARRP